MNFAAWARTDCAVTGIWLGLGLQCLFSADFSSVELRPASAGNPGFTLVPPASSGVLFTNQLQGDMFLTNAVAHNGSGLAVGDVDGDARPDIYFCGLQGGNSLYRNLGNWRFEKMDLGAAACANQSSTAAVLIDIDGDHDLDLLVNGIAAGTRLFLNDGRARWTESASSGLSRTHSATSMALADIEGDGDLDLYVAHYIDVMHLADPTTRFALGRRDGKWEVTRVNGESTRAPKWKDRFEALPDGSVRELPEVHALYRNDGHGKFTAIQHEPGVFLDEAGQAIPPFRDWGLAVMFRDFNGDLAPDFYVCNDNASPDRFWINTGNGTFRAAKKSVLRHTSRSSMGIDVADVDRDGQDDFLVVDMLARDHRKRLTQLVRDHPDRASMDLSDGQPRFNRNTLFLGRSDGTFAEAALMAGVAASDWSWCPIFLDVDLDGYEDLLVSTGFSFDVMDQDSHDELRQRKLAPAEAKRQRQFHPRWPTGLAAFENRGDGTFASAETQWGLSQPRISYGMALGDLDADGDLDLVVNNLNDAASVYRNDSPAPRIAIRLHGKGANTAGIGARIRVTSSALIQSQEMISGGRYLSSDDSARVFAAKEGTARIEVLWRDGNQTVITNAQANRSYAVRQPLTGATRGSAPSAPRPHFIDVSTRLGHLHSENAYDDWSSQPLLPRRLSRLGPGLGWTDVNGDGWEDLIVAGAHGGKAAVYRNTGGQNFERLDGPLASRGDQLATLGWVDATGQRRWLISVSNMESASASEAEVLVADSDHPASLVARLPLGSTIPGPLATADIDRDGDLDLFVGGRFVRHRYPEPASSAVFVNESSQLNKSETLSQSFASVVLVSGAAFADFDSDGSPDLALALDWGPLRIFRNTKGRFEEATEQWGLAETAGWWTSVAVADFDSDGRLDFAAGNWGCNTDFELFQPARFRAYYSDWNNDGVLEILEAFQDGERWLPVRDRTFLSRAWPELAHQFTSHAQFAKATVSEILGRPRLEQARYVEAALFESSVFLNRGSRFERVPLPRAAQLSPIFSLNTADFDGDGIEDLFASQNFFGGVGELTRHDAGRGLWLRGVGDGTFQPIDAGLSGINILGEQRGAAIADFNHDGRPDLAVTQNNGETKLLLNQGARPGLRVSLKGPASNPDAIGALLRIQYKDARPGPIRLVHAGSGYLSQDAATHVLGLREGAAGLWVRWPGGKERIVPIPANDKIEINFHEHP